MDSISIEENEQVLAICSLFYIKMDMFSIYVHFFM